MIEPTTEMVRAFAAAADARCEDLIDEGVTLTTLDEGTVIRAGLAAVLAIVERDRCMERKGHVYHPLAKSKPGRGVNHPHYCVSCSNGETRGPGCMNCRQTGFDQTPWPTCEGCAS